MKTYRSSTTGLFVGRQADQVDGEDYETVEVPTNPKEDLITFLNEIQSKVDGQPLAAAEPTTVAWLSQWEADSRERGKELELAQELDEAILRAPFQKMLRLAELVYARLGDFAKEKQNASVT